MTIKSFQFIRDEDAAEPEAKQAEINGTVIDLVGEISSIDLMLFGAGSVQGGYQSLVAVDQFFRTVTADDEQYAALIGVMRDLKLEPTEIAEVAQGIAEMYTVRPTEPS